MHASTQLVGRRIGDIREKNQIFFLSHSRGSETCFAPENDLVLEANDMITVQAEPKTLKILQELNALRAEQSPAKAEKEAT